MDLARLRSRPGPHPSLALALAFAVAALFAFEAQSKLRGHQADTFAGWGYPGWFSYVVGAGEALCALLLLATATRFWGAAGACGIMAGAIVTHVVNGEWTSLFLYLATATLAVCAVVGLWTRPRAFQWSRPND